MYETQNKINQAILALNQKDTDAAWHILTSITVPMMSDHQINMATQEIIRKAWGLGMGDDTKPVRDIVVSVASGTYK